MGMTELKMFEWGYLIFKCLNLDDRIGNVWIGMIELEKCLNWDDWIEEVWIGINELQIELEISKLGWFWIWMIKLKISELGLLNLKCKLGWLNWKCLKLGWLNRKCLKWDAWLGKSAWFVQRPVPGGHERVGHYGWWRAVQQTTQDDVQLHLHVSGRNSNDDYPCFR